MATSAKKSVGKFRRCYAAHLCQIKFEPKFNPLHLLISSRDARLLRQSDENDRVSFVCAIRVKRDDPNTTAQSTSGFSSENSSVVTSPSIDSLASSQNQTFPKHPVSVHIVYSEDIIVSVWPTDSDNHATPFVSRNDDLSLSIDGDSSDDDVNNDTDSEQILKLFCSDQFASHYECQLSEIVYIRGIEVFPLTKAIFSVSDKDAYEWIQQDIFRVGLLKEICHHEFLVRQNDTFLAPFPETFLKDESFHRSWYMNMKAIACVPFQMGIITAKTEILIYFEKDVKHLPSDNRHLSGNALDKYVDLHNKQPSFLISDFLRTLSTSSDDKSVFGSKDTDNSFDNFFLTSALVIQQSIHWSKILCQSEDSSCLDLTTVLGMPKKLLKQFKILNGTILKICLYPYDLLDTVTMSDVQMFLKKKKPKQKLVKVQCLTEKLDESENVFISSLLLFNLQNGPPIVKSPLLVIEVSHY